MRRRAQTLRAIGTRDLTSNDSTTSPFSKAVPLERVADRALSFAEIVVGCALGIYLGLAIGSLSGHRIGDMRAEQLRHTIDVFNPTELGEWQEIPWTFARVGASIGAPLGAIAIMIIQARFLEKRMILLHKKGITDPQNMAEALGKSNRKTTRMIGKLARKGKLTPQE